ncbi:hypothetical protein B0H16DRAFT_1719620 [Mycena metata]|uniref:Uncharacterized protein n=1 Tax=Mycena metata TaxID=1033252 RepID=A0AAD7JAS2_9AGAR|nr:hypothetical protein B0H16DRAFT_1719620 [Mycena metata]
MIGALPRRLQRIKNVQQEPPPSPSSRSTTARTSTTRFQRTPSPILRWVWTNSCNGLAHRRVPQDDHLAHDCHVTTFPSRARDSSQAAPTPSEASPARAATRSLEQLTSSNIEPHPTPRRPLRTKTSSSPVRSTGVSPNCAALMDQLRASVTMPPSPPAGRSQAQRAPTNPDPGVHAHSGTHLRHAIHSRAPQAGYYPCNADGLVIIVHRLPPRATLKPAASHPHPQAPSAQTYNLLIRVKAPKTSHPPLLRCRRLPWLRIGSTSARPRRPEHRPALKPHRPTPRV